MFLETNTTRLPLTHTNTKAIDYDYADYDNENKSTVTMTTSPEDDQDTILFGSMNAEIADALADRIRTAIARGVESLPLLQNTEGLIKTIERSYMRIVDVIEAYGSKNVFSIANHPPKRRQRILDAFLQKERNDDEDNNNNNDKENSLPTPSTNLDKNITTPKESTTSFEYPSKDKLPSKEAVSQLEKEVIELQEQLKEARGRRNELLVQKRSLQRAKSVASKTMGSLDSLDKDIQGPVTAVVMDGQGVQEMTKEGKQLIAKLDESKRDRSDEEEDEIPVSMPARKKRLGLEEEYREQRRTVETTLEGLAAVRSLLKK